MQKKNEDTCITMNGLVRNIDTSGFNEGDRIDYDENFNLFCIKSDINDGCLYIQSNLIK